MYNILKTICSVITKFQSNISYHRNIVLVKYWCFWIKNGHQVAIQVDKICHFFIFFKEIDSYVPCLPQQLKNHSTKCYQILLAPFSSCLDRFRWVWCQSLWKRPPGGEKQRFIHILTKIILLQIVSYLVCMFYKDGVKK